MSWFQWKKKKQQEVPDFYPTAMTSLEFLSVTKLFTMAFRPDSITWKEIRTLFYNYIYKVSFSLIMLVWANWTTHQRVEFWLNMVTVSMMTQGLIYKLVLTLIEKKNKLEINLVLTISQKPTVECVFIQKKASVNENNNSDFLIS